MSEHVHRFREVDQADDTAVLRPCEECGLTALDALQHLTTAVEALEAQAAALLAAIRLHRDARGDDRCWRDDEELYRALPEGYTPPARDTAVEIERCMRFIASRRHPETEYVSPERELERLRAEVADLRERASLL